MNAISDLNENTRHCIDAYLDSINTALQDSGMSPSERRSILEDLRTQILEMAQSQTEETPTFENVQNVIAELDPPEFYVEHIEITLDGTVSTPQLSKVALVGALWTPICLIVWLLPDAWRHTSEPVRPMFWVGAEIFSLVAPIVTMLLGFIAVHQIRFSRGKLYGLGLAVADTLFFPLVFLGAAASFVLAMCLNELLKLQEVEIGTDAMTNPVVLGFAILFWLAITAIVGTVVWRASTKPVDG